METKRVWTPTEIRELRQDLGFSQKDFAGALGLSRQQTVSEWEVGLYRPSPMAKALLDFFTSRVKTMKKPA